MDFRIAFQGGGANFITLLAAAKAVYDLSKEKPTDFKLEKLSGTSAGSIVASILSLGIDPELIRRHLQDHGQDALNNIIVMPSSDDDKFWKKGTAWASKIATLYAGHPFFTFEKLEDFIADLHNKGEVRDKIKLSKVTTPLILTNTDLVKSEVIYWDSEKEKDKKEDEQVLLARAVANSCSIPIAFKNYVGSNDPHLVDGGIIENFPLEQLTKEFPPERVIGFSFEQPQTSNLNNALVYLGAILSAMINSNIKSSSRFIPEDNIISLPYEFGVLDFETALDDGLNHMFDLVCDQTRTKLQEILDRELYREYQGARRSRFSKDFNVQTSAEKLYEQFGTKDINIQYVEAEWTLNSLRSKGFDQQHNELNTLKTFYEVERSSDQENLVMKINLTSLTDKINLTLNEIDVSDEHGNRLEFVPLIGKINSFAKTYNIPVFLFIDLSQMAPDSKLIKIIHVDYTKDVLPSFMSPGSKNEKEEEDVGMFCSYPKFERIVWSVHLPESVHEKCDFEVLEAVDEDIEVSKFVEGKLSRNYAGDARTPANFVTVKWEATEPAFAGQAAGFRIKKK